MNSQCRAFGVQSSLRLLYLLFGSIEEAAVQLEQMYKKTLQLRTLVIHNVIKDKRSVVEEGRGTIVKHGLGFLRYLNSSMQFDCETT